MRLISAGILVLACVTAAQAQDILYEPDEKIAAEMPGGLMAQAIGTQSAYFDSNPLFLTAGAKSLWGSITSPELIVNDTTPLATIRSDTILTSNNFNQSAFDSNDIHSKLNLTDQIQRWGMGLQGNVDYDTTRTSEMSNYGNLPLVPARHFGGTVAPQISYNFLPTDKLGLSGSYTSSHYDSAAFTDYEVFSASPSYTHQFDPLNSGSFSVQAQRFRATEGTLNVVDTIGPSIGWRTQLTPQMKATASVGYDEARQETAQNPNASWTPQLNFAFGFNFKGIQDVIAADASRAEYPFGNGAEAFLTQVSLNDTRAISPAFAIGVGGNYQSAEYQSNAFGNLQSLAGGHASLIWHATNRLDVTTSYQYQHETLTDVSEGIQNHVGMMSVAYRPQAWGL